MIRIQNMILKISKLREVKLDKSALESIQRKLRDPETSRKIGLNTKRFIDSERGLGNQRSFGIISLYSNSAAYTKWNNRDSRDNK